MPTNKMDKIVVFDGFTLLSIISGLQFKVKKKKISLSLLIYLARILNKKKKQIKCKIKMLNLCLKIINNESFKCNLRIKNWNYTFKNIIKFKKKLKNNITKR